MTADEWRQQEEDPHETGRWEQQKGSEESDDTGDPEE